MKTKHTLTALAMLAALGSPAMAGGLDVRGEFASLSASAIATALPSNAESFSALAGQVGGITVTIRDNLIDADTISGSLTEVDGWRNNGGGIIGAAGFAGVRGAFERD